MKLTTHIGEPIRAGRDETAYQLKQRVESALQEMMSTHQRGQPNIAEAVLDRLTCEDVELIEEGLEKISDALNNLSFQD